MTTIEPARLFARLTALPVAARIAACIVVAVTVLATIAFGIGSHAQRAPLFAAPLRTEQLAEVEERLAEWNVPYGETAGSVLVDVKRRNDLLLRLSIAGVPHAHVATTSETLANVGVLTPDAVIDAQTRAGLAGDIEVGLRSVDGIDDARVIIAPAKVAQFGDESSRDASASVRVRLHPGAQLGDASIAGIRAFVAASVAGLDPSHVTILDDRGVALGDAARGLGDAADLERSLQSALDASLGANVALVRVHAQLDRTETERRDVRRSSLSNAPIERDETGESYGENGKRYEKHAERVERGSDTSETVVRAQPGRLVRTSTAVFVDRTRVADLANVRALAAATVGFDAKRGDTLEVQAIDFPHDVTPKRDGWWLAYNALLAVLPGLFLIVAVMLVMRAVVPPLRDATVKFAERASVARTAQSVAGFTPSKVRGALAHEPPHAAAAVISALPAATAAAVLELYPPHEREAIVRRMQRPHPSVMPTLDEVLGQHA